MTSDAEKELSRIERELDAKDQPLGKPPMKQGGWFVTNDEKPKNQSLDAVVVGALLLLGIGATFLVGESLNKTEKTQLSSGAIGAAVGLLRDSTLASGGHDGVMGGAIERVAFLMSVLSCVIASNVNLLQQHCSHEQHP